jgi:hypothetical protein
MQTAQVFVEIVQVGRRRDRLCLSGAGVFFRTLSEKPYSKMSRKNRGSRLAFAVLGPTSFCTRKNHMKTQFGNPFFALTTSLNPFMLWVGFAVKMGEMMLASAQVIGHRTNRMANAGVVPSLRDQREFTLMGQEKIEAVVESAQAVASRMMGLNQQIGTLALRQMMAGATGMMALATTRNPAQSSKLQAKLMQETVSNSSNAASQLANTVVHVADQGLKPIHTRATANAKRLAKLKK